MEPSGGAQARPQQPLAGEARRIGVRDPQNFVAGLSLICVAAFGLWASSDLPLGRLGAFGPGLLPRIVVTIIAAFGLMLVGASMMKDGSRVRLPDFSAILVIAAIAALSALAGFALSGAGFEGVLGLNAFASVFTVLYIALMVWLVRLALTAPGWLDRSGLRGPIFVIGGLVAFALTVRGVGLLVAGPLLAVISGAASSETRIKELVIFALAITALCIGLFKYALKLPMPILVIPGVIYI